MSEKRYFWLKLADDFFTSKRIKRLRSLAGGDTYTIIYLKMQLKALKTDGYLYFDGIMNDFAEELALDIDESPENVKVTIQYLLSVGLLECSEDGDEFRLPYMQQLIGSETSSTRRSQRFRAKQKEQKALQCNTNETLMQQNRNGEIDIEIEIEKEIEKDKRNIVPYQLIADLYNETCVSFPRIKSLSEARKKAIKARLKKYSVDDFKTMFEKCEHSAFLKGSNKKNWSATFDWMINDTNMAKILDGNYDDKKGDSNNEKVEWDPATYNCFE